MGVFCPFFVPQGGPTTPLACHYSVETLELIRYLRGSATEQEVQEILEWLESDTDGSALSEYKDAHRLYNGVVLYGQDSDTAEAHASGKEQKKAPKVRWKRALYFVSGIAAALALVLGTHALTTRQTWNRLLARTETVRVPNGKFMELTLEDGTTVWMNSGSSIEYPVVFGDKQRTVKVRDGEVIFEVTPDKGRPFTVNTFAADITVTGTRFDVDVDESENRFRTTLMQGSLDVVSRQDRDIRFHVKPGETVSMTDDRLVYEKAGDIASVDCWTRGFIDMSGVSLKELIRRYEKAFGVTILYQGDAAQSVPFSRGRIRISDGLTHAMDILSGACGFSYTVQEDTGIVTIQ